MFQPEIPHRTVPSSGAISSCDLTNKAGIVQCTEWMNLTDNDAIQRDSGILLGMDSDDSNSGQHTTSWPKSSSLGSLDHSFSPYILPSSQDLDSQPAPHSSWVPFHPSSPLDNDYDDVIQVEPKSSSSAEPNSSLVDPNSSSLVDPNSPSSLFDSENQDTGSLSRLLKKSRHCSISPTKQSRIGRGPEMMMQTRTNVLKDEIRLRSRLVSRTPVRIRQSETTARPIGRMPAVWGLPRSPPRVIGLRDRKPTVSRKSIERTPEAPNVDDDWETSSDETEDFLLYQESSTLISSEKSRFVTVEDLSEGLELFPVRVWNDVNGIKAPPPFTYITGLEDEPGYTRTPCVCQCRGVCNDVRCHCMGEPYSPNITEPAYNNKTGLLDRPLNWLTSITPHIPRVIWECSDNCPCGPNCSSRSAQLGLRYPFEIFMTQEKGWGVRPLRDLPAGAFIAEYSGEVKEDFDDNQTPLPENWYTFWLIPEPGDFNGQRFYIDASKKGNISRFINHGCSPNVCAINVFYDDNDLTRGMHIGFYTIRKVKAFQELTLDYAADFWNGKLAKKEYCKCRASRCYWKDPTIKTKKPKRRFKR